MWLMELLKPESVETASVAHSVLILALVAGAGLVLGSVRVYGVSLGVAGVLFAGLLFGHFDLTIAPEVLEFTREFGLILFVYTIGIQVGPGFFASLRQQGLRLSMLGGAVIVLGVFTAIAIHKIAGIDMPVVAGLFSGGTTNTPSLAAAQQALRDKTTVEAVRALPGLGYAISYPFGVLGVILTMMLLRLVFRIDIHKEDQIFKRTELAHRPELAMRNLEVQNANLAGLALKDIPMLRESGIVVSRLLHGGGVSIARPESRLAVGDVMLAVGPAEKLEQLRILVGVDSNVDLTAVPSNLTTRMLIVTHKPAIGKTVDELELLHRFGVTITRIARAEIELPVSPQVRLQFGDTVLAVGEPESIERAAPELGNSPKALNHPILVPVFVGIALGVVIGSWPFYLPGLPAAVKLGVAGGPLLVALVVSRLGKVGPLVWYMPTSANFMLREVGITLFLACVGLKSGDRFLATLIEGDGLLWMGYAALITLIPILIVGVFARLALKMNYLSMCGLLAGSMTDPPALAFATTSTGSDSPSIAYATVYPLTMFLRVLAVQILVIVFV